MICKSDTVETGYPGTVEFLDLLLERTGLSTDYQLSKHLGAGDSRIGNYRSRRARMSPEMALRVARELELPGPYVLACVEMERAATAELRATFESIAKAFAPKVPIRPMQRPLFNQMEGLRA